MKYRSQIVTAASGSIGGCTYSRNRSGPYIRNRSLPVNTNTQGQQNVRAALSTLVARWTSTLTAAQRSAWDVWAFNTPQTDSIGNPITITGQNAYIKMNVQRIVALIAVVDVAPIVFSGAALTPPQIVSATAATDVLSISFTNTDLWATAVGGYLFVYVGRQQNVSKNFFAGPYQFAGRINGAVVPPTSPLPITSPFNFAAAQRIFARFVATNADARISTRTGASAVSV